MVLDKTLHDISNKFSTLKNTIGKSSTIAYVGHLIELNTSCTCNICNETPCVDLSDINRSDMMEIIKSCSNFEYDDPIDFIICALQSSYLNKLSKLKQFVNRYDIISSKINTKLMNNIKHSLPTILQTDILMHTIFNFVGGDYFISLCKCIEDDGLIEEQILLMSHNDRRIRGNITLYNIYYIALVDCFGNIICRLSGYFRCPDSTFVYIDADENKPSVFTFAGDKMFRWKLNETNQNTLLSLDTNFGHTQLDDICTSRYWNYYDISNGIFIWKSNIYIISEEHQHIANRTSSQYVFKISILQFNSVCGSMINKYEIDIDDNNPYSERNINSDYDFMITSSKWLLLQKHERKCSYCFVLFQRTNKIINFIDPLSCTISRKIKINESAELKIMFIDNNMNQQIIAYSLLFVFIIDINGNVMQHINIPFGDRIQFVTVSNAFVYVDVLLGQFASVGNMNNKNSSVLFQEIASDEDSDDYEVEGEHAYQEHMIKLKWFSDSCWRYILDINNLDILAFFSVNRKVKCSKLYYNVNPTNFRF